MANKGASSSQKKKKPNIVQRMMFGDDGRPEIAPDRAKLSKWALFKELFFYKLGTMVALNLMTFIFAVPAVLVILKFYLDISVSNGLVPYSSNIGLGYPVVIDAVTRGNAISFVYHLLQYTLLVPCVALLMLGISGNMFVVRKLIWGEQTSTFKDFFRGIKKCWLPALVCGFVLGCAILLFTFTLEYFDVYGQPVAYKVVSIIFSTIALVFVAMITVFSVTQKAAFNMKFSVVLHNAMLFVVGTHVIGIFFVALAIAPAFLLFIPGSLMIIALLYVFLGFSFFSLVTSLYCHSCYERYLYDKADKIRPAYAKRSADETDEPIAKGKRSKDKASSTEPAQDVDVKDADADVKADAPKPSAAKKSTQYKNPKKRKKSIDEGSDITPLAPTFRREDLERLEREHEQVLAESEDTDVDPDTDTVNE